MNTLEIIKINPTEYGIEEKQANELVGNLPQIKAERDILSQQYDEVVLLDIEASETSKRARELRLRIRDNRTKGIDVWHKTTKDFFLKGGQFIDAIKRQEVAVNQRMEENLENIEKYFENKEKERKAKLNAERISELEPYNAFVPMGLNFGDLSDEEYSKVLNGAKLQFDQQQEEEHKVEAERVRQAEIQKLHNERKESLLSVWQFVEFQNENFGNLTDVAFLEIKQTAEDKKLKYEAEQEEIRKENERLAAEKKALEEKAAKERAEAEAKAAKERAEQDAKLKAEQEAKAKIEAELKAKKDAEAKAEQERIAEEKRKKAEADKLAKAPIKKQLNVWVSSFDLPTANIENEKADLIKAKFEAFKKWALSEIESM